MDEVLKRLKCENVKRIAIMGGTFDPIHFGHLATAETVRSEYNFDKVLFVPSGNPPHKNNEYVTYSEHRYLMVQLAVVSNPYFEVSRMEIDRMGSTYTVDTIKEIIDELGSDTEVYFITGADAILEILTWRNPKELLSICKFIAVTRPGYQKQTLEKKVIELKNLFNSDIIAIDVPGLVISSTDIRKRVASNKSIKYLVPQSVEEYIFKNGLYGKME